MPQRRDGGDDAGGGYEDRQDRERLLEPRGEVREPGDAHDADALYELIQPFADRNAVSAETIVCMGPLSLYAGLMALVTGELDAAVRDLEDALARCVRMGTPPFEHTATHEKS